MIEAALLAYGLFLYYLAYVTLIQAKKVGTFDQLRPYVKVICWSILITAGVLDFLFNVIIGSVLFLDIPRELMFTSRCERHMSKQDWRGSLARWFCRSWLNPFTANHCH